MTKYCCDEMDKYVNFHFLIEIIDDKYYFLDKYISGEVKGEFENHPIGPIYFCPNCGTKLN